MRRLIDWADHRTGFRGIMHEALYERIPGGARWRYVWGSTLVFTFVLQMITGTFLWMAYSPSTRTAWESVFYIQNEMQYGNVVRGIHHYAAQAMIVLMALHLMQVIIDGAYKAPREFNFWIGLILLQIVLGLALTGYLLPWDQKGYYATQVATKIAGATPLIGAQLQTLIQGGTEYGHHTLTRFFAMHAGVLPAALIGFLVLHIAAFRKHGITTPDPNRGPESKFWPDQILKDAVACLAVLAVIMTFAIRYGAELNAPADPSEPFLSARPEWYFLFLFRFLKFHAVEQYGLAFGAIYIPGILMGILALMPLIARVKGGHFFNLGFMSVMLAGAGTLTVMAVMEDNQDPDFIRDLTLAKRDAHRINELASSPTKIPVEGAVSLLRNDPLTQGPRIFKKACSSCHRHNGKDGLGFDVMEVVEGNEVPALETAADLGTFGSREWVVSLLTVYPDRFAPLKNLKDENGESIGARFLEGDMASFCIDNRDALLAPENKESLEAIVEFVVAQSNRDFTPPVNADLVKAGRGIFETGTLKKGVIADCMSCHSMHARGEEAALSEDGYGPDLTGYASAEWLKSFISDPGAEQHYGDNNLMPAYGEKLSEKELDLLVRWMVGDYYHAEGSHADENDAETPPAESTEDEIPTATLGEPDADDVDDAKTE
ncbi:MAG: cytochrome b N-terminal domain-containing protein [Planctomycetota bacterium]|nr:cytochrome b N-terminal domain-containing protein [Planctomycetota bacterium]MDA1212803.1 cytochrome b N-terminal domain-containing protein [Planctomycetota bacterium]